jgi:hypothetical protein
LVLADAWRLPNRELTVSTAFDVSPDVEIWFAANRVFPSMPDPMPTWQPSAVDKARARSARRRASSRLRPSATVPPRVDDVDVAEARRGAAVAHGVRL